MRTSQRLVKVWSRPPLSQHVSWGCAFRLHGEGASCWSCCIASFWETSSLLTFLSRNEIPGEIPFFGGPLFEQSVKQRVKQWSDLSVQRVFISTRPMTVASSWRAELALSPPCSEMRSLLYCFLPAEPVIQQVSLRSALSNSQRAS